MHLPIPRLRRVLPHKWGSGGGGPEPSDEGIGAPQPGIADDELGVRIEHRPDVLQAPLADGADVRGDELVKRVPHITATIRPR